MAPSPIEVRAYAFASTLHPRDVPPCFAPPPEIVRSTKSQIVMRCGEKGWAVAYDFGAIVFVGIADDVQKQVLARLLARVGPEPHAPEQEDFAIELRPGEKPSVKFDRVVAGELTAPLVELVALIVAQSIGMEYYEEDVAQTLVMLDELCRGLAESGHFRGSVRELLKVIGRGMTTRNQVISTLSLLDAPVLAWENEAHDRLYRELRALFEIEDRYRALDYKLRTIHDNLDLLVDLVRHRRSLIVEVGVFLLVGIEVVLFVFELVTGHGR